MKALLFATIVFVVVIIATRLATAKSKPTNSKGHILLKSRLDICNSFALYNRIEEVLATNGIPEQVIDGCMSLLKQYIKLADGAHEIEMTEYGGRVTITIQPNNITIKVK